MERVMRVPEQLALAESASIALAAALMNYEGVHQLPVTRGRRLIGMVDALDLLKWLAARSGYGTIEK